jgi:hypothetical protein
MYRSLSLLAILALVSVTAACAPKPPKCLVIRVDTSRTLFDTVTIPATGNTCVVTVFAKELGDSVGGSNKP